jgi:hypothetical protein
VGGDPILGSRFRLPPPSESLPAPLGDVLASRHSVRRFAPLDPGDLATLLYHSARVHDLLPAEDGYPATTRAAPSAGARHPIDLIVVPAAEDVIAAPPEARSVAYFFDPLTCELVGLPPGEALPFAAVPHTAEELLGCRPPVTLVLGARLRRTLSRYRGGLSLVYRDAGALMAVVAVVASALRLSCCAIATPCAGSASLGRWVDVGGIVLGGAAA